MSAPGVGEPILSLPCGCKKTCFMKANPQLVQWRICKELEGPFVPPKRRMTGKAFDIALDYIKWLTILIKVIHTEHEPSEGFRNCNRPICVDVQAKLREINNLVAEQ